jgi:hypothetical protein
MPPAPRKNQQPKASAPKPAAAIAQEQNNDQGDQESLIITSKVEGFRRAGRAWSKSPTTVLVSELSDEQIEQLTAEPMLEVAVVEKAAE